MKKLTLLALAAIVLSSCTGNQEEVATSEKKPSPAFTINEMAEMWETFPGSENKEVEGGFVVTTSIEEKGDEKVYNYKIVLADEDVVMNKKISYEEIWWDDLKLPH